MLNDSTNGVSTRPLAAALLAGVLLAALTVIPATTQEHASSGASAPSPADRVQVGQEAPGFALPDLDGDSHRLSELDQPLVLVFFRGAW